MRIALFERTKHKHEQCSFRFLAEQHNALANGTLLKRFVGETTGHRPVPRLFPSSHLPPRAYLYRCFSCCFYWNTQREPLLSRKGERFNTEIFFYHRKKIHWLTFHKRSPLTTGLAIEMPLSLVKLKGCPWHTLLDALKGGKVNTFYSLFCSVFVE